MAKQIIKENEKEFWHNNLDSLLAQSGRHRTELVANRLDQLHTVDKQYTTPSIDYAEKITLCVGKAIQACSDKSCKILTGVLLLRKRNYEVAREMGYSKPHFFRLKQIALKEFSRNFAKYQDKLDIEPFIELVKVPKTEKY